MDAETIIIEMIGLETDLSLLEARLRRRTKTEIDEERGKHAQALAHMRSLRRKLQQMETLLEYIYT